MRKNPKEPLVTYDIPTRPWQVIGQDPFILDNHNNLVTVDYYSEFRELDILPNTVSEAVLNCTKTHFARHGILDQGISDNGPQLS